MSLPGVRITDRGRTVTMFTFTVVGLNIANVAATSSVNTDVTVPGVAVGDLVVAFPPVALEASIAPQVSIAQAADTVRVRVTNASAAGVDPAAADWTFLVIRFATT